MDIFIGVSRRALKGIFCGETFVYDRVIHSWSTIFHIKKQNKKTQSKSSKETFLERNVKVAIDDISFF